MHRFYIVLFLALSLTVPPALADDMLSAHEIRRVVPGKWSGTYQSEAVALTVAGNGTLTGRYAGISASGTWTIKRKASGARLCLTFRAIVSDTKCGELYRKGNNVLYGFSRRGAPRLWLKRS